MKTRDGFTLVEVIVSLLLLGTVVLSLSAATAGMIRSSTESARNTVSMSLVQERLGQIAADPDYDSLEENYRGVETGELQGVAYSRTTLVEHVRENQQGGRAVDVKRITVTVQETGSGRSITRSISVGAP